MDKELCKQVNEQVEKEIKSIVDEGVQTENVNMLGKLVDIHKDLANEKYWNIKEEVYKMRYDEYNEYGRRGVPGSGRGRYNRGDYGRRGVRGTGRGRYRGEDSMDEMYENYSNYSEASEEYNRGNYGAENPMLKSIEGIMKNMCEIIEEISEIDSPEVMHIIKKYAKKINEME